MVRQADWKPVDGLTASVEGQKAKVESAEPSFLRAMPRKSRQTHALRLIRTTGELQSHANAYIMAYLEFYNLYPRAKYLPFPRTDASTVQH